MVPRPRARGPDRDCRPADPAGLGARPIPRARLRTHPLQTAGAGDRRDGRLPAAAVDDRDRRGRRTEHRRHQARGPRPWRRLHGGGGRPRGPTGPRQHARGRRADHEPTVPRRRTRPATGGGLAGQTDGVVGQQGLFYAALRQRRQPDHGAQWRPDPVRGHPAPGARESRSGPASARTPAPARSSR